MYDQKFEDSEMMIVFVTFHYIGMRIVLHDLSMSMVREILAGIDGHVTPRYDSFVVVWSPY